MFKSNKVHPVAFVEDDDSAVEDFDQPHAKEDPKPRLVGNSVGLVTFTLRLLKFTICAFSVETSDKYDHPDPARRSE